MAVVDTRTEVKLPGVIAGRDMPGAPVRGVLPPGNAMPGYTCDSTSCRETDASLAGRVAAWEAVRAAETQPGAASKSWLEGLKDAFGMGDGGAGEAINYGAASQAGGGCEGWLTSPLACLKAKGINIGLVLGGILIVGAVVVSAIKPPDVARAVGKLAGRG